VADEPRLFHFRVSHYNEKVRWALDFKRWPHVRTRLTPGLHIPRMRWLTGQSKVPVLVLDGKAMPGSSAILAEIERRRPDPPLFPSDPKELERALALQKHFDEIVAPELRTLFWSTYLDRTADAVRVVTDGASGFVRFFIRIFFPLMRPIFRRNVRAFPAEIERARARLVSHFERLESEIQPSGYLVRDRFSVADLSVAAVMTAIVRPPEFSYPLPEPMSPGLVSLREELAGRPGFAWVRDMYARHRGPSSAIRGPADPEE
jgi:glutathione S-transferase